jgi:hypothetical protein
MSDILQRRGILKILEDLIIDNPEGIVKLMKDVLVVSATANFMSGKIVYECYSKHFDLLKDDEVTPEYIVVSNDNEETFEFVNSIEYKEKNVKDMLQKIKDEIRKYNA